MEEEDWPFRDLSSDEEEEAPAGGGEGRRRVCPECVRPVTSCLCDAFPDEPIRLKSGGVVLILQHPLEKKRKLATVPLLRKSLERCEVLVGRDFRRPGRFPELDRVMSLAEAGECEVFVLYPGAESLDLAGVVEEGRKRATATESGSRRDHRWALVAIDGTWQQAKEMFNCSKDRLLPPGIKGIHRVNLNDGTRPLCRLPLRSEPLEGCVTTLEAVATALGILEDSPSLADAIMAPLAKLVRLQQEFSPALRERAQGKMSYKATRRTKLAGSS